MKIGNKQDTRVRFNLARDWQLYLLLLLPIAYFIIFKYIPMYGVTIAFKDFNIFKGILQSEWVGLSWFRHVFIMEDFRIALWNTLKLNILDLLFSFPAPILLAICLNELTHVRFKKISQTILYLPYFMSWVIIGGLVQQFFATNTGMVNNLVVLTGSKPIPFLTNEILWTLTYLFVGIWKYTGWNTIIYLAAITGIDSSLYEAAEVDGAGRLTKIFKITIPSIQPTIVVLLIMAIGSVMGIGFERPYVMGNAMVKSVSEVISTFVYKVGLQSGQFSIATAVGFFQSLVGLVLITLANTVSKGMGGSRIW